MQIESTESIAVSCEFVLLICTFSIRCWKIQQNNFFDRSVSINNYPNFSLLLTLIKKKYILPSKETINDDFSA